MVRTAVAATAKIETTAKTAAATEAITNQQQQQQQQVFTLTTTVAVTTATAATTTTTTVKVENYNIKNSGNKIVLSSLCNKGIISGLG